MTVLERLEQLRTEAERGTWTVTRSTDVLALLRIARAAENYDDQRHSYRCEFRTAAKGWKHDDPPIIECVCGLDELRSALSDLEANT